jgi:hypothetical protein
METKARYTAVPVPYEAIRAFAERHHIRRLALFGSVLRDDFHDASDIDVLVEFDPAHIPGWNIVSIEQELTAVFGRKVDMRTEDELSRHFRQRVRETAMPIYG